MNSLEDRLKAALDARAQTFEAGPNAWLEVRRRTPLPPRRGRWLLAALPVVMIAVFVPVLLSGGLGRNTAMDPDVLFQRLMQGKTLAGEPVVLDDPTEGTPLRLWFAKAKLGNPEFCSIMQRADQEPFGSCEGLSQVFNGWYEGSTGKEGAETVMDYGVTRPDIVQVKAVTAEGKRISGEVHRPEGAPLPIWTVTYSGKERVTAMEFLDATSKVVGQVPREFLMSVGRNARPAGPPYEQPGGLVARPYQIDNETVPGAKDMLVAWARGGKDVMRLTLKPQYLFKDPATGKDFPVTLASEYGVLFGAARKDVARIEVSGGGAPVTLTTAPDPWNLGLALFAAPYDGAAKGWQYSLLVAYDAQGKEVFRHEPTPRKDEEPEGRGKRVGAEITLPGTQDFTYGPVRAWFAKSDGQTMLCASGGVRPDGGKGNGCNDASADPHSLGRSTVRTYLPEPGVTVAYGTLAQDRVGASAILPDGRRIPAEIVRAKGAPAAVWAIRYPTNTKIAAIAYQIKGKQLEQLWMEDHSCWEIEKPEGTPAQLPGGLSATLHPGNCLKVWKDGKNRPGIFEAPPGGTLRDLLASDRPLRWVQDREDWYGIALPGTARIEATLKNGAMVTATTVPDPWKQGVVLFSGSVPKAIAKEGMSQPGQKITGYSADGRVLWTYAQEDGVY